MPHDSNPRTGCAGHPLPDIPLEDLRRSAAAAVSGAKDSTIAAFQVTDDDAGDSRTATRADLLELVAGAASRQGLAEMLSIFQDAGDWGPGQAAALDGDPATWPRDRKIAWCKARAAGCPWESAANSMIQDMARLGIPLSRDAIALGTLEGMRAGEAGVREWIRGIS
jgi:hypothetical protein